MLKLQAEVKKAPVSIGTVKEEPIYRVSAVVNLNGCGKFEIPWLCEERNGPIGPFEAVLEGYRGGSVDEEYKAHSFTRKEIKMLEDYLWRTFRLSRKWSKDCRKLSQWIFPPDKAGELSTANALERLRCVDLSSHKTYRLPFKVRGYGHLIA